MNGEMTFAQLAFESPALRALVRPPWALSYGPSVEVLPGLIAPDAHVEFVFQTGSPCATVSNAQEAARPSPRAMIYAQRHGALRLVPTGANAILAFRTTPAVASALVGRPLTDCWDRPVDLAELIGREAEQLLQRIEPAGPATQADAIESWLASRLEAWGSEHERNRRLQSMLLWRAADEPMSELADRVGVTARTLRRHFARHAGISPKQLSMSGRILRGCHYLSDRREMPIAQVALALGFGDQAAFGNAFRRYVGMTPAQLRAEPLIHCERPQL